MGVARVTEENGMVGSEGAQAMSRRRRAIGALGSNSAGYVAVRPMRPRLTGRTIRT